MHRPPLPRTTDGSEMATATQLAWLKTMVAPAQLSQAKWGVPASVTLAQCILESAWGTSQLARRANNYFGVKASPGDGYCEFTTREVVQGRSVQELARFAKYPSAIESFDAHARLLASTERYRPCMQFAGNCAQFAISLKLCGYSTEPAYPQRLGELGLQLNLTQYDNPSPDGPATIQEEAA